MQMWEWSFGGEADYYRVLQNAGAVSAAKADEVDRQITDAIETVAKMQTYGMKYQADNESIRKTVTKGKGNYKCVVYYEVKNEYLIRILWIRQAKQNEPTMKQLMYRSKH